MHTTESEGSPKEANAAPVVSVEVWGLQEAHFIGHSFGAFVVAWVLRYAHSCVARRQGA